MNLSFKTLLSSLALGSAFLSSSSFFVLAETKTGNNYLRHGSTTDNDIIPNEYLITFNPETESSVSMQENHYTKNLKGEPVLTKEQLEIIAEHYGGKLKSVYHNAIYGMAVTMDEANAKKIAKDPRVELVEQNGVVKIAQQSPATWGLDRIDKRDLPLDNSYTPAGTGAGTAVYVLDTGVQVSHDEFQDSNGPRAYWGPNFTGDGEQRDCQGHGTHVAGTVGGNIYGVAKDTIIISVKVLSCSGSGTIAGIVDGMEWVMAHAGYYGITKQSVVNMSIQAGRNQIFNNAARNLHQFGIVTAVAAGNYNSDACSFSPASEPAIMTVGSTTRYDYRSSFSNYGSCIDIFAPGSDITAAWIGANSAINTISGTSMASPHVAGGLAIAISLGISDPMAGILSHSTPNKVSDPRGSANNLLYVGYATDGLKKELNLTGIELMKKEMSASSELKKKGVSASSELKKKGVSASSSVV